MLPPEALDFGEYRPFRSVDTFPGLTDRFIPLLIKEAKEYTYLLAVKDREAWIFAWDKVSPMYNAFQGL